MRTLLFPESHNSSKAARLALFVGLAILICGHPLPLLAAPTITYVQGNYATPQTPQTTVNVQFTGAQAAGDLNVVVVGWNDSVATVSSVKDSSGNTYNLAVGPTVQSGTASQSIYYAKNIVAAATGANTVSVTFSTAAVYPDIRILEYSGADPANPVDVIAGTSGNSSSSSSGSFTTSNPTDLLFGADLVQTLTTGPGTSFTRRLLTSPDGDIAEDRMVTATGTYAATAPVSSGMWIMQAVAFRAFAGTTPTVTGVSPNTGPAAGGTSVTITGTNFAAGATVTFGGNPATNVTVMNSTTITATTPAGAGQVTVTVTVNGQSGSLTNGFTYVAPPTVTSVSPNSGTTAGGTSVTITGTNFATGATVTFGTAAATSVVVSSSTKITATTPAGSAGSVTVTVTNPGSLSGSLANAYTYVVIPTVSSVSPNNGSTAGGTAVTITGTNFAAGATVSFGSVAATSVSFVNSTTINATTPAGSAGPVTVTVTVNGQSGSLTNGFTYIAPPTVSSVSPNSGPTTGGTSVTITGTNFATGAGVTFGTTPATSVVVSNSTTITATTPAGSAGAVTVTVTNPGSLSGSLASGFTYVVVPTVTSVNPNSGPTTGGTSVTITGTNFASGATVMFGTAAATSVVIGSSTSITATTPTGSVGAVTVTVTVNGQSGSLANGFTYVAPPTVTGVSPNSGSTLGGTSVTITGTNFANGATVTFGSAAATSVVVSSSTKITATTPAGAAGPVTVTVTNPGSLSGSLSNAYTYVVVPTVTNVSPNSGPAAGGTSVTITGTNFASGATVTFGSAAATNVVVASSTSITATTPAGSAGPVTVTVTVNGQTGSLTNGFTYVAPPSVTVVNPNSGTTAGGTSVTITGTNFASGATVKFGSAAATSPVVMSSTSITATTPTGTAGAVTVTVTNPDQQSGSLSNAYTYVTPSMPTAPGSLATAGGPAAIVDAVQGYINSTSLTTHTTAPFDSTGGDVIVMFASSHAGVTMTPSDSFGNTWIPIAGPTSTTVGFDLRSEVWYARNPIVGAGHTVTVSLSVAQPLVISILVLKGSNVSSPIDAISLIGSDNGTQSLNASSPTITTSSANDVLLGFLKVSAGATFTSGPGYIQQPAASSNFLDAESGVGAIPGNYAATFTINTAQTWQSAIVAASPNPNQATLSWSPSTESGGTISMYLVERCQGAGCGSFSQIGTSTGTTFNDTGLAPSTTYTYRVRAQDSANNIGPYSNTATFTTPPTIPAAPGNVTATSASSHGINLSWVASTENAGSVASYSIERCQGSACSSFAQIGTAVGTTFEDTGLTTTTTYTYRIRAIDTAGNASPYSNLAIATTSAQGGGSAITYVQGNYATPQSPQTTVNVTFTSAQKAGDLNVVVVGWNDSTAAVSSVTDKSGNTYTRAVGPTVQSGVASQSIYYAKNIAAAAAGANSVTITFATSAAYPDIRILEYAGADPANPLDGTAASSGNSSSSNSGTLTTANASDLLFGANLVQTITAGPGVNFTARLSTQPDGDIAEDRTLSAAGSYSADAPISSGQWIMQAVAFSTAPVASAPPPTVPGSLSATGGSAGQITLAWTASTSSIGIANYIIQRCQGSGCTNFAQLATTAGLGYTDSGLAPNSPYSYEVQAVDTAGNVSGFSNVATAVSSGLTVSPRAVALTPTLTQQFTASGGSVTWSVDGVVGGSSTSGTITSGGLYTPPATAGSHTITATAASGSGSATVYITNYPGTFTRDIDNMRTGLNANETVLTPANVNVNQFGKLFSYPIDGTADASPLYVANLNFGSGSIHNVVYVATEHDSVYAFDADARQSTPLWQVSFINPSAGITTVPPNDTGECCDISPEIGITGSPVIDHSTNTLYVVVKTKEVVNGTTNYYHRLHALDLITGAEKFGGPVVISASAPGTGAGSVNGTVPFLSLHENQRSALLLTNGVVYIAFGGHGDQSPYHGWILGYNASTLQQTMKFITSPNDNGIRSTGGGQGSGVWQSGDGLATDATGNIYFSTGNGIFDANTGGLDYGDSFLKLSPTGQLVDSFTPFDQQSMNDFDIDLGSGGVILLPDSMGSSTHPHLAITAGKNGTIYVIDRDKLGGYNSSNNNQIVQSIVNTFPNGTKNTGNFKAPVFWNGNLYFSADADYIQSFSISNGLVSTSPISQSSLFLNYPGGTLEASSNGNANAILWAIQRVDLDPSGGGVRGPGSLHAFDATNLATELYNSNQNAARDQLDFTCKWSAPLVANGHVYVASESQLSIFGLLP